LRICVPTGKKFNAKTPRRKGAKKNKPLHLCAFALKTCLAEAAFPGDVGQFGNLPPFLMGVVQFF
jgi:hypothetical protein